MIKITLPDGSIKVVPEKTTPYEIAQDISEGLARQIVCAKANDKILSLNEPLEKDTKLELLKFENAHAKEVFWHSTAHLLAIAITKHFPKAKLTIGPPIAEGFYYDIDLQGSTVKEEDLQKLEQLMKEYSKKKIPFVKEEISHEKALQLYKHNQYKQEIIEDYKNSQLTIYKNDDFYDLCKGPHLRHTGQIKAFKLTKTGAVYWRGDENNPVLQRIYGISFPEKKQLKDYLQKKEEAAKRDHRKLGKQLDLFTFSEKVGSGLPLFTPKGTVIRDALQTRLETISKDYGYNKVSIPHLAKIDLYKTSGHAQKFEDELFKVKGHYGTNLVLKPVNCPHHTQIYASQKRSYKDLPLRYMESTRQYRDEKPGELSGLARVRAITVDDGHIFCRPDQIKKEVKILCDIIKRFYDSIGLYGNHWVSLSYKDPNSPEKYIGSKEDWDTAQNFLAQINDELELEAKICEGEAAIYGPKLDFMFYDSLDREWQLATVQLDFSMPKRFELEYTYSDGKTQTPVMIHRAILGSFERFMAVLIEHFAGRFPLWLSPVQVSLLPIADRHKEHAQNIASNLKKENIRVEIDESSESINKKVRTAQINQINYIIVLGDTELEQDQLSIRTREGQMLDKMNLDTFIQKLKNEINEN